MQLLIEVAIWFKVVTKYIYFVLHAGVRAPMASKNIPKRPSYYAAFN